MNMKTLSDEFREKRKKQCKNCVNFISCRDDNKIECDFDYFEPTMYEDAILFTPELFDCEKFEDIRDI